MNFEKVSEYAQYSHEEIKAELESAIEKTNLLVDATQLDSISQFLWSEMRTLTDDKDLQEVSEEITKKFFQMKGEAGLSTTGINSEKLKQSVHLVLNNIGTEKEV